MRGHTQNGAKSSPDLAIKFPLNVLILRNKILSPTLVHLRATGRAQLVQLKSNVVPCRRPTPPVFGQTSGHTFVPLCRTPFLLLP
jgi:hypothetical protein